MKKQVSNEEFVKACLAAKSIADIAQATGLAACTVNQRRVRMRNNGVAIPELKRGGGRKASAADLLAINQLIANSLGKPVEEIAKEGEQLVSKHEDRLSLAS